MGISLAIDVLKSVLGVLLSVFILFLLIYAFGDTFLCLFEQAKLYLENIVSYIDAFMPKTFLAFKFLLFAYFSKFLFGIFVKYVFKKE